MALTKYKAKRDFKVSPEPIGGKPDSDRLRFVVQKHQASRLHYDFRLEMGGVLKSWAVPKGPSTDPSVKRLAMMVEDHPYDYRNFEGTIPSGYGAGTVMVWDEGFYEMADSNGMDKIKQDKTLQKGILSGKLHVLLFGTKLKGEFALIKTSGKAPNAWLMFKVKDKYISTKDITLKNKSVISKKTLEQLQRSSTNFYGATKEKGAFLKSENETPTTIKKSSTSKVKAVSKSSTTKVVAPGKKASFPTKLSPMLATAVEAPFDDEDWQFEIKWDGYRALAYCNKKTVDLKSRNDLSFTEKFFPIHNALQDWNVHAVVDGEIVVLDEDGKSNFAALQNWKSAADGELYFYVFDILWMNGKNLMELPMQQRRSILKEIVPENSNIRFSENFEVSGIEFYDTVKKMGLEGMMAKKADSIYVAGNRSKNWLKIKANQREEMIIGGYTKNKDSSKVFSSLLLGVYENGDFMYKGKVGTGFSESQQTAMLKQFKPHVVKTSAFASEPNINKTSRFQQSKNATAVWMKPVLVCEVNFTEMTSDGVMRHPSFVAMRIDKNAKEVVLEKVLTSKKTILEKKEKLSSKSSKLTNAEKFLEPSEVSKVLTINKQPITLTNLQKIYWPKQKITKSDLLHYYHKMAAYILPYLKDRPQSMNRYPNGIEGKSFYFKDVSGTAPDWIETFDYKTEKDSRVRKYLVAKDEASLLYMANLGCIEMNPWHSRVQKEDYPSWCVIDLDPSTNVFQQVIDAANVTRQVLENMGVTSYPKTSGSTGIHIYIPLGEKYTYEQSQAFAKVVATLVQREIPEYTSIERMVKSRKGKMYIDFLQNRAQATVAAPYSVRPKLGATVSMPLQWDEIKKGLKMSEFNIHNALERVETAGDIFKPVLGKGIDLMKVIKTYNKGFEKSA